MNNKTSELKNNYREILKMDVSLYHVFRKILGELNLQVVEHGDRVAYLYLKLSQYRGLAFDTHFRNMMIACYAHDIGAYKTEKFLDLLKFDVSNTQEHCVYGYLFMKHFSPLGEDAEILLYHHTLYSEKANYSSKYVDDGILMHMLDRILQIADVTSALIQRRSYKCALEKDDVIRILKGEADAGKLDSAIIDALIENYDVILDYVWENAAETIRRYERMNADYDRYLKEFSQPEKEAMEAYA